MQSRNRRAFLAENPKHEHARRHEIRSAALAVVAPMKSRPEPRTVWDEIARPDRGWRRFEYTQQPMRLAAHAGADIERIADFYVVLFTDAIAACQKPVTFDVATAGIRAIREQSEAVEWQARALATGCECDSERAARETREAIGADQFYLGALRRARLTGRTG
jgi:hypothetical protein